MKAHAAAKKEQLRTAQLKKTALDAPSRHMVSVWDLIVIETSRTLEASEKRAGIGAISHAASPRYKELTPDRREVFMKF